MLSKYLESFVQFFRNKIENSENKFPWFELTSWKDLELSILRKIGDELRKNKNNDINYFQNYVVNQIDVNRNELTTITINSFNNAEMISDSGKKIIRDYFSAILNKKYLLKKDNYNITIIYLHFLLIPILEKWRTLEFNLIYDDVEKMNQLLEIYNIKYKPKIDIKLYYNSILYSELINKRNNIIYDVISLLQEIKEKYSIYKKEDSITIKETKQIKNITTNNKSIVKEIKKVNREKKVKEKKYDKNIKDIIKHRLQYYKKEGLISLCVELKIETYDCKLKNDYLLKLIDYYNDNLRNKN